MAKGFSVWALLKGKDAASGPIVKGLGKIRAAGLATSRALRGALNIGGKGLGLLGIGGGLSIGGAIVGIRSLVQNYASATDEQSKFARQNRITIGSLQEMSYAAGREGLSVDGLKQSIIGLTQNVGQMAAGRGRALKFLSAIKGGKEVVRDLTRTTNAMDALYVAMEAIRRSPSVGKKAALARALGLDPDIVRLAAKSTTEINALRAEMRGYGTDSTESGIAAEDMQDANERLTASFEGLKRVVGAEFAPSFRAYMDDLAAFLANNKGQVRAWAREVRESLDSLVEALPVYGATIGKVMGTVNRAFEIGGTGWGIIAQAVTGGPQVRLWGDKWRSGAAAWQEKNGRLLLSQYSAKELRDAETEALASGMPIEDSAGRKQWSVIGAMAAQLRAGQGTSLTRENAAALLPIGGSGRSRPVFGDSRLKVEVDVQDNRINTRAEVVEGPAQIVGDPGVSAAFGG